MPGMNKLPLDKRAKVLELLCEGMSMRSIERVVGCSINTVDKPLREAGEAALLYHDVHVRGVKSQRVQCDEIWSFVGAKQKNVPASSRATDPTAGDCWAWTAIDADNELLLYYLVGGRDAEYALMLMDDLRHRLANRVQLTTDGHRPYLQAVEEAFGADVDCGMLVKLYGEPPASPEAARRYSRLTKEFAEEAIDLVETRGRTRRKIAGDRRIGLSTLLRWLGGTGIGTPPTPEAITPHCRRSRPSCFNHTRRSLS